MSFFDVITHSAASNATMVDSDGLLKWRPHNLLLQSEFASGWAPYVATNSNGAITESSASNFQSVYQGGPSSVATWTFKCKMVPVGRNFGVLSIGPSTGTWAAATFDLVNGVVTKSDTAGAAVLEATSIVADGDGYICGITVSGISATYVYVASSETGTTAYASYGLPAFLGSGSVALNASMAHLYRSDLGGMVAVPADARATPSATTYVPTTTSAVYLPRRGHHVYNGSAWVNEGLLHESEARVNLITYSEDFTNASWRLGGNAATPSISGIGPDGVTSATLFSDNSAGGTGPVNIDYLLTVATSTAYTASVYAKKDQLSFIKLVGITFTTPANGGVWFDLDNGTVGTEETGYSGFIEDAGNGWYRCSMTFTTDAADTSGRVYIYACENGSSTTVDLDGTSSIYIYGAQLEAGSTPSSYIPTAGATVTRAAETLTVPAANLPYDSTNMSIQMQGRMTYADTGVFTEVAPYQWRLDSNNRINLDLLTLSTRTGQFKFSQGSAGTFDSVDSATNAYSPGINVPFNIASRHGSTFINGAVDGVALTADTTPTALPDLSATDLQLAYDYMGTIKLFRMWSDDLADAGIAEASA